MKKLMLAAAGAVVMSSFGGIAYAQDMEAKKRENVTTHAVYMVKLNYNKGAEFAERVKMQNEIAAALGEPQAQVHHVMTGPYDRIVVVEMKEGMASLDWEMTPSDARFQAAMVEKMGSMEAYREWQSKWPEITERPVVYYTHTHND